ncbi:MAG: N-acetyltransferase [Bauldia sp.]|nr:N-acetyltransferase [Bauldia sp.]MCW5717769.1 N-acetyltransferase [Bauldia sp.]
MVTIDTEHLSDRLPRETLLDAVMGPERFLKPSQLLRDGRAPEIALVARDGRDVVGTVRLWEVDAGGRPALLLGPLAVSPDHQGAGIGSRLMRSALNRAAALGHGAVILVGDAPYYARFGFSAEFTANLAMPAKVDPARFLAVELRAGALAGATGAVTADMDMVRGIIAPVTNDAWRVAA